MEPYSQHRNVRENLPQKNVHPSPPSAWDATSQQQIHPRQPTSRSFIVPQDDDIYARRTSRRSVDSVATDIECDPVPVSDPCVHDVRSTSHRVETDARLWRDNSFSSIPLSPPRSASVSSGTAVYPGPGTQQDGQGRHPSYTPPLNMHEHRRQVVAMPGTMSSRPTRSEPPLKSRRRPSSKDRQSSQTQTDSDRRSPPLGSRFKTVFKDMFHKNSVDATTFERIEDKHWSDDW